MNQSKSQIFYATNKKTKNQLPKYQEQKSQDIQKNVLAYQRAQGVYQGIEMKKQDFSPNFIEGEERSRQLDWWLKILEKNSFNFSCKGKIHFSL